MGLLFSLSSLAVSGMEEEEEEEERNRAPSVRR